MKTLENLIKSEQPFILYKTNAGFKLYTQFSKKIILNNKNIKGFLNNIKKQKSNFKETDLFVGFFGYEILNNLIGIKLPKQKSINFPKGIFYKPEKVQNLKNIDYKNEKKKKIYSKFKINLSLNDYTKIFEKFKKKIKSGDTYQIKICTKYKNKSIIDPLVLFSKLCKTNLAPESFFIKDKNYSIISCSPENLIDRKGDFISTKPIAGTLKKNKKLNKSKALKYFRKNI
ncbi:MAG: aminodeoxychorismate synthase component I, partial [Proteobacteria bacterium]